MVALTAAASAEFQAHLSESHEPDVALRVGVQPGGCAGLRYEMYLDATRWPEDTVADLDGVPVVIDAASAPYLREARIDFGDGPEGPAFMIANPAVAGVCGCGHQPGDDQEHEDSAGRSLQLAHLAR